MFTLPRRDGTSIRVVVVVFRRCDPIHEPCLFCAPTSIALQNELQRALRESLMEGEGDASGCEIRDDDDDIIFNACDDDDGDEEDEDEVGGNNDASLSHLCFCFKEEREEEEANDALQKD